MLSFGGGLFSNRYCRCHVSIYRNDKKENAALTCFAAADDDDEDDDDVLSWLLLLNKCVLSCLLNVVMPTSLVPLPVFFSLVVLISKQ